MSSSSTANLSASRRTEGRSPDTSLEAPIIVQQLGELDKLASQKPNGDCNSDVKLALQVWRRELVVWLGRRDPRNSTVPPLDNRAPVSLEQIGLLDSATRGVRVSSTSLAQDPGVDTDLPTGKPAVDTCMTNVELLRGFREPSIANQVPSGSLQGSTEPHDMVESSSSLIPSELEGESYKRECAACAEEQHMQELAELQCGHLYCADCLQRMVSTALDDHQYLPPRCCRQPFVIALIEAFISHDLLEEYQARLVEQTADITYCHERTCSARIPWENMEDNSARCPNCAAHTCTTCKGPKHEGECPVDTDEQEMLQGIEEEWQRCYVCWRIIIRSDGCNHMT